MLTLTEFTEKVLKKFARSMTDQVFLMIQNDRELMQEYLRSVEANGLDAVNQQIGRRVKECFNLENMDEREEQPASTLIQSYQKHKLKDS